MTVRMQQAVHKYYKSPVYRTTTKVTRVVLYTATEETCKRDLQKRPTTETYKRILQKSRAKMTCGQNNNKTYEVQETELRRYGRVATVSRIDSITGLLYGI